MTENEFYSVTGAAKYLNISASLLNYRVKHGLIRPDGRILGKEGWKPIFKESTLKSHSEGVFRRGRKLGWRKDKNEK